MLAAPPADAWLDGAPYRRELHVTSPSGRVDPGYSYRVVIDHASWVDAGQSFPNGRDVRVASWSGVQFVELHRVVDTGSGWNQVATTIWFATDAGVAADAGDLFIFHGDESPAPALESAANVFVFAEDFEDGGLSRWTKVPGQLLAELEVKQGRAHGGTHALRSRPLSTGGQQIYPNIIDPPGNQLVEAWIYAEDLSTAYWALFTRFDPGRDDAYDCGPHAGLGGYVAGRRTGGVYASYIGTAPSHSGDSDQWLRMTVAATGDFGLCCMEDRCFSPSPIVLGDRFFDGGVGFGRLAQAADVGVDGGKDLFIDDVRVRRFVLPEPKVAVGPLQSAPDAGMPDGGVIDARPLDAGAIDAGFDAEADGGAPPERLRLTVGCNAAAGGAGSNGITVVTIFFAAALFCRGRRAHRVSRTS